MQRLTFAAGILFCAWTAQADYTVDSLVTSINDIVISQGHAQIEDVLPALPEELKTHYTLQYKGGGVQSASFQNPRVLLFGKDGSLVLTFNGDASQELFNSIEALQFNKETSEFELYKLDFPISATYTKPAKNPAQCMACHSTGDGQAFPIWGRYPFWPGFYGSQDEIPQGQELEEFKKFEQTWAAHPRYTHLLRDSASPNSPFSTIPVQNTFFRPNGNLGKFFQRHNAKALAKQAAASADFEKYLLLASPSFFQCRTEMSITETGELNLKVKEALETAGWLEKPVKTKEYFDTANVTYLLGSSPYAWGQLPYKIRKPDGSMVLQDKLQDPYFLDAFFMTTPNFVIAELSESFFAKYPNLQSGYVPLSHEAYIQTPRLNKGEKDREIYRTTDNLGMGFFYFGNNCEDVLNYVRGEFSL